MILKNIVVNRYVARLLYQRNHVQCKFCLREKVEIDSWITT